MSAAMRELWLLSRDRGACTWLLLALLLSCLAVAAGLLETRQQQASLVRMLEADRLDRQAASAGQSDWGGVAYYSFHLTYDPPSRFAFAALGQRDSASWKHRVRMLALEGQIYESDAAHPDFALIGRFDFAFVAAVLAPLLLVLLLHDLRGGERVQGRHDLLCATSPDERSLWRWRTGLRVGLLGLFLLLPLALGTWLEGAEASVFLLASLAVGLHLVFWWLLCALVDPRRWANATKLTVLVGFWLLLAVLLPALLQFAIERQHPLPDGAEIILTQREAVNSAWDLPKADTMRRFVERHPQWQPHSDVSAAFEWKWYYAFQQVGDQQAEALSQRYRDGQLARDQAAASLTRLAPPAWLARRLQRLAETDAASVHAYEQSVRRFHAALRAYYYPKLFLDQALEPQALACRPEYAPLRPLVVPAPENTVGGSPNECEAGAPSLTD